LARCLLNLSSYRLDAVGSSMGLVNAAEHRALVDALLLKDIFLNLMKPV
jgi:DNA polymerase III epsilon subunit-like protein